MIGRHVIFEKAGQFFVKFTNVKFYQNLFYPYEFHLQKEHMLKLPSRLIIL